MKSLLIIFSIFITVSAFGQDTNIIIYWDSTQMNKKIEKCYTPDSLEICFDPINDPATTIKIFSQQVLQTEKYWDKSGNEITFEDFVLKYGLQSTQTCIDSQIIEDRQIIEAKYAPALSDNDSLKYILASATTDYKLFDTNKISIEIGYLNFQVFVKFNDSIFHFNQLQCKILLYDSNNKLILSCLSSRNPSICFKQWYGAVIDRPGYYFLIQDIYLQDNKMNIFKIYGPKKLKKHQ